MTRAAVVGAAGFIGSHLCAALQARGADILAIDRRPIDAPAPPALLGEFPGAPVLNAIARHRAEWIFLLGGTSSVGDSFADPGEDLSANAGDTLQLLEWMRRTHYHATVLFVSSAAVYGQPARLPATIQTALQPLSPYGISKLSGELYVRLYHQLYGLDGRVVRPFSVYGPRLRKQVVWDILRKMKQPDPARLSGTGDETRDFLYVQDLCAALLRIAESGRPGGIYNACTGQETAIRALARMLSDMTGWPLPSFSGRAREGDPLHWRGDCAELHALDWSPQVSLEWGLRQTVDWFLAEAGTIDSAARQPIAADAI